MELSFEEFIAGKTPLEIWQSVLQVPAAYSYKKSLSLIKKYSFERFDAELYLQNNGPDTVQRLLKVLPKKLSGGMPAVAVPFYFPEAMIGFELDTLEPLPKYAGITMMADLAERGFICASADASHLTYLKSNHDRGEYLRWGEFGKAINQDYPLWCGMGKLTADTRLVIDALCADDRVDSNNIAIAGHSLGGKMAFYAGCVDERVRAILASDFGIGWEQTNWRDTWYWGDKVDKLIAVGVDHSQLLNSAGGKPFMLLAGQYDNAESGEIMQQAEVYRQYPEHLQLINHATGHRPPQDVLAQGYDFLEKYLKH